MNFFGVLSNIAKIQKKMRVGFFLHFDSFFVCLRFVRNVLNQATWISNNRAVPNKVQEINKRVEI